MVNEQRTARSAFGRIERMFGGAVGHRGEARSGRAFLGGPDGCQNKREIEALGKRVERCDRQLDECLKDTPPCGKGPMPHVWGLRV